jgi:hypothetical protein
MPAVISDMIKRTVQSAKAFDDAGNEPAVGRICSISKLTGPDGHDLDVHLSMPAYVCLSGPLSDNVWRGFGVSSDPLWSGYWDMLLEADLDEPFDPALAAIQVWNPLEIYLPTIDSTLGQLSADRFETLIALEKEYLFGDDTDIDYAQPGRIGLRETFSGRMVLTGSPLGDENDPRYQYQTFYHQLTQILRQPALLALQALEPETAEDIVEEAGWKDKLQNLLAGLTDTLISAPQVQGAMGNSDDDDLLSWEISGKLHLDFHQDAEYQLIVVNARSLSDGQCCLEQREADAVTESFTLSGQGEQCEISIDTRYPIQLCINCDDSKEICIDFKDW